MSAIRQVVDIEKTAFSMPYSPLIRVKGGADYLFISGATALPLYHQHPHEYDQLSPPEDVREQTQLVMENLKKCLAAGGATFADVIRADSFLVDMQDQDAIGEVMETYFRGNYPAGTMVEVRRLVDPRLKLEVNLIAAVDASANG